MTVGVENYGLKHDVRVTRVTCLSEKKVSRKMLVDKKGEYDTLSVPPTKSGR
jgi:hypothetical protein